MGRWTGEATEWQMRSIGEGENSSRLDGLQDHFDANDDGG